MQVMCSVFPDIWKIAKVIPVFESGSKNYIENYKPIGILNFSSIFFESLVTLEGYLSRLTWIS